MTSMMQNQKDHNEALGNVNATDGLDRCYCGSKYWQDDHCIDCGIGVERNSLRQYGDDNLRHAQLLLLWSLDVLRIRLGMVEVVEPEVNFQRTLRRGQKQPVPDPSVRTVIHGGRVYFVKDKV